MGGQGKQYCDMAAYRELRVTWVDREDIIVTWVNIKDLV